MSKGWLLAIVAPLLALSCGDDDSPNAGPDGESGGGAGAGGEAASSGGAGDTAPEGTIIGPKGGVVVSDDGLLELTIPAGALETATPISISAIDADESLAALADTTLRGAYRFEPDGTVFAEPATFAYTLDEFLTGDESEATLPMVVITTESEGTVEAIAEQAVDVNLDTNQVVLSGPLSHFSQMAMNSLEPGLDTMFFYVTIQPKPPQESELGTDYGVGLFVHSRNVLANSAVLTYDDESTNLDYSEGPDPYEIAEFGANGEEPGLDILPVGTYGCAAAGPATFAVQLTTGPVHFVPLLAVAHQGNANNGPKNLAGVLPPPSVFKITIGRDVTCTEEGTTPDPVDGPPYSGFVDYRASVAALQAGTTVLGVQLNGAFYGGGAAQADFDAWVARKRRALGIMADRQASGVCREVPVGEGPFEDVRPPASTVTLVASGAANQLAFAFPDTVQTEPVLLEWLPAVRAYIGEPEEPTLQPSPSGIEVFVPASAAAPSVTLPGWDAATWQDVEAFRGEDGLEVTWDAALIEADHVHAFIIGYSDAGSRFTECFAEPADQQLLIPYQAIEDTFVPAANEEVPFLEVYMYSGRRTGAVYDGRTLEGMTWRTTDLGY